MNILDRYFAKQFLKVWFACLLSLLLCMLVHNVSENIRDFIHAHSQFSEILHYYSILGPEWIVEIMPATLLLSLLFTLSDMSKHGEITAMRASGLNLFRLLGGFFILGIFMAITMLYVNLTWVPTSLFQSEAILQKMTHKQNNKSEVFDVTYRDIKGNRFWRIGTLNLEAKEARDIVIIQSDESVKDNRLTQTDRQRINAASGLYSKGHWTLYQALIFDYTKNVNNIQKLEILEDPQLTESPAQFLIASKKMKRMTTCELLENLSYRSRLSSKQYAAYSTELHFRIAFPIANFIHCLPHWHSFWNYRPATK
jgi:lipopolysaccharide export system permease protein